MIRAASATARAGSCAWCSACDSIATSTAASLIGSFSSSPRFQMTFDTRRRRASALRALEHDVRAIDRDHARRPARRFDRQVAFAAPEVGDLDAAAAAGRARATRPPSSGRARAAARRACRGRRARRSSPSAAAALPAAAPRRRGPPGRPRTARTARSSIVASAASPLVERRRQAVVAEAAVALLADQPGVLQQAEMPRDARLRQAEDAGQLGDVQALAREHPQQAQPRLVAEQPVERRRLLHIYKSTCIDVRMQRCKVQGAGCVARRLAGSRELETMRPRPLAGAR